MKTFFKAAVFSALCLGLCACGERETPADAGAKNSVLLMGNSADPATLDPSLTTGLSEYKILCALFEGLAGADPKTLEAIPAAAESWSFDGSKYIFKIRGGAKWSDGEPLKASDFVFAFRRTLNPALGAEYANLLFPIKNAKKILEGKERPENLGAKALGEKELEIELEYPCPHFLSLLCHNAFFPQPEHVLKKFGAECRRDGAWVRPQNIVSNGAFILKEWRINDLVRAEKNPNYWDVKNVRLNAAVFYPIANINTEDRAFRAGQLHLTDSVPAMRLGSIKKTMPQALQISDMLGVYYYTFNTSRPPLDDPRVRRALALAIDRRAIISNFLKGGQKPALTFVPPSAAKNYACPEKISENINEARRLLAEAGYENGKNFPKITITYNTSEQHRPIAEAIQGQWKKYLNIDVELYNMSWPAYLDARRRGDFYILRSSWIADYASPENFLSNFLSASPLNHSKWKSQKFDALMGAAKTSDTNLATENFENAEAELMRGMPVMPIYFYTRAFLKDPRLKGWLPNPLDYHNYKNVYFETEAEK
ncbi:MAG: peptide ABC transporter substrate-binding protein [Opitutales bacterium]|nr:peptide ABC transporter substrate-binding protein [Opitutales bacterium]